MKSLSVKLGFIVVVIGLLIFEYGCPVVNIANTECAWVLWMKTTVLEYEKNFRTDSSIYWELINAFPAHEKCMEVQKTLEPREIHSKDKDKNKDKEKIIHIMYICLPDTVDPRK